MLAEIIKWNYALKGDWLVKTSPARQKHPKFYKNTKIFNRLQYNVEIASRGDVTILQFTQNITRKDEKAILEPRLTTIRVDSLLASVHRLFFQKNQQTRNEHPTGWLLAAGTASSAQSSSSFSG